MSFVFSVGDFVAGAQLAYTLGKALSDSKGAAREYQELIAELNVVHKVLLQVDELRSANQLAQATVNALLFTVNSVTVTMETFIEHFSSYQDSLNPGGSGNLAKDVYRKTKWAVGMPQKIRDLKMSLATMLSVINCLVSLACYYNTGYDVRCNAFLKPCIRKPWPQNLDSGSRWKDVKVQAQFAHDESKIPLPDFAVQSNPVSFFRAGQVFAVQITSDISLVNERKFRNVNFGALPLKPIPELKAIAEKEHLEDRAKRLAQIRGLPLEKMAHYCNDLQSDEGGGTMPAMPEPQMEFVP